MVEVQQRRAERGAEEPEGKGDAYARYRLYKFLNRKSQRRYRLKYAETYYGEYQKLGLIALTRRRYR